MKVYISKSDIKGKKYKIVLEYIDGRTKTLHIGSDGMDDYTLTGDDEAKKRYISRHKSREDWTAKGITTKGFWAYHLLWRFKTKEEAIKKLAEQFNIKIIKKF